MKVSSKGQVTIPKEIREALGIRPGDEVEFEETEEGVVIRKADENPFETWKGAFGGAEATVEERMRELRGDR